MVTPGLDASAQVGQYLPALPSAGLNHTQHALHEATTLRAVRPPAYLPQDHTEPSAPLCLVVRRLYPWDVHEGPQPGFVAQQFLARSGCFPTRAPCPTLQRPPDRFTHRPHGLLQLRPRQLARSKLMPQVKQRVTFAQQPLADGLARLAPPHSGPLCPAAAP